MFDLFNDALNAVSGEDFEERPVEIEEFVTSEEYLNLPPLSHYQYQIIRAGSQIYRYETLVSLYGEEKAQKRWAETFNEIILQLGKGSGKDYTSTIVCSYIVYLLLCLKDPAKYYGQPSGDTIDIVNIAVNAEQANRVFFVNVKKRINNCSWFNQKVVTDTQNSLEFVKSIRLFSGHSEREAFEGLNLLVAVLDEISAFELESTSGNWKSKTAQATYDMYRDSVDSRFSEFGKVLMLSFPRFKGDFIQMKYENDDEDAGPLGAVVEKEVIMRKHTFKIDNDLPDGTHGNEFSIEWEEDHILRYRYPKTFALRRPSWEVNPTKNIEMYKISFHRNKGNALGKFACMPSNLEDGFFKNHEAIEATFTEVNGVDEYGIFLDRFQPEKDVEYYLHVDLAQKHDHCAVAVAHVADWVEVSIGAEYKELHPHVIVDAVRWWTPTKEKTVDFADVRNFIIALRRRGFNIKLATFDRWNSHDTMNILENEHGIKTDTLSVGLNHYQDFMTVMYDKRLKGPKLHLLNRELGELMLMKNKVEHPRKGSKDLSDAVCGAIFNAIDHTSKPNRRTVEVKTYADILAEEQRKKMQQHKNDGVIVAPKRQMPDELQNYFSNLTVL